MVTTTVFIQMKMAMQMELRTALSGNLEMLSRVRTEIYYRAVHREKAILKQEATVFAIMLPVTVALPGFFEVIIGIQQRGC